MFCVTLIDAARKDDWDATQLELLGLQAKGKVIFYQKYDKKHEDVRKRPFIVVLQDEFMRDIAKRFSTGNSWALDSTFKTNNYDLPLYAAVVPNEDGRGMPIFYMLCSKDKGQGHQGIAIEIALECVFKNMGSVRPSAILIDKDMTSLNAITTIVSNDPFCWKNQQIGVEQIGCRILLCHFHAMKAWSEHLLPRVPLDRRDELWQCLTTLLHCAVEVNFDFNVQIFFRAFEAIPGVIQYIHSGWTSPFSPWRSLWPKFGRMFPYGGMDTTNHIERHWEWIKYSLLMGKVNRSLRDLVVAIMGSAKDGTRVGGPTLLDYFKLRQGTSK